VSAIHKRQSPHPSASPPPSPLGKANTGIPFVQIAETLFSFGTFSTRCKGQSFQLCPFLRKAIEKIFRVFRYGFEPLCIHSVIYLTMLGVIFLRCKSDIAHLRFAVILYSPSQLAKQ
ncbi:MAG: hypothetical protein IKA44_02210, partial [Clostridia bacterium]|nr:hypothetical protein [Clostridia bacterium]